MRGTTQKKGGSRLQEREEQLRKARAAAPTLRSSFPTTACVRVTLSFGQTASPVHAAQSYSLYPAARMHFEYPCPYGDCDGVYDLGKPALQLLKHGEAKVQGSLECTGTRSREKLAMQPCQLHMDYTISAEHELGD